jgi:hypothetical protein
MQRTTITIGIEAPAAATAASNGHEIMTDKLYTVKGGCADWCAD